MHSVSQWLQGTTEQGAQFDASSGSKLEGIPFLDD